MAFLEEIFSKNSRKFNKFIFSNNEFKLKYNFELQPSSSRNRLSLTEKLSEKNIDTLDLDNLKSLLKEKCRTIQNLEDKTKNLTDLIKLEKEKNDEMRIMIKLQKKEIEQNYEYITELQKELTILREKTNVINTIEIAKVNNRSNYFMSTDLKEKYMRKNDFKDFKLLKNEFLGDSSVSFSSNIEKIENNVVSKKWSFDEKQIVINFKDFEIKFKKIDDLINTKGNAMLKKEFKFIDIEIYNPSDSALLVENFHLDSTKSKL